MPRSRSVVPEDAPAVEQGLGAQVLAVVFGGGGLQRSVPTEDVLTVGGA